MRKCANISCFRVFKSSPNQNQEALKYQNGATKYLIEF